MVQRDAQDRKRANRGKGESESRKQSKGEAQRSSSAYKTERSGTGGRSFPSLRSTILPRSNQSCSSSSLPLPSSRSEIESKSPPSIHIRALPLPLPRTERRACRGRIKAETPVSSDDGRACLLECAWGEHHLLPCSIVPPVPISKADKTCTRGGRTPTSRLGRRRDVHEFGVGEATACRVRSAWGGEDGMG